MLWKEAFSGSGMLQFVPPIMHAYWHNEAERGHDLTLSRPVAVCTVYREGSNGDTSPGQPHVLGVGAWGGEGGAYPFIVACPRSFDH